MFDIFIYGYLSGNIDIKYFKLNKVFRISNIQFYNCPVNHIYL